MSIYESLSVLGWNGFFENQLNTESDITSEVPLVPARVVGEERSNYRVQLSVDLVKNAVVTGKLRHDATSRQSLPAVGDWVLVDINSNGSQAYIHKILDRKSCVSRKVAGEEMKEQIIASNIDHVLIATSLNQDLNLKRLERYLTIAWDGGAIPVLILTKSDLCVDLKEKLEQIESISTGVDKVVTSCMNSTGLDEIKKYFLPNKTNVLVGSSGVGKSTLVNSLFGEVKMKTQEIREDDDKGKHTTTSRNLFIMPSGGMIIDTPGMRELQIWGGEESLEVQFQDIEDLKLKCKFSNCVHQSEPGCAVQAAISTGELEKGRWENFLKLKKELEYLQAKADKGLQSVRKNKWKKIHNDAKVQSKLKKSGKNF